MGGAAGGDPDKPMCGFQRYMLEGVPADILIVLDRSTSMKRTPMKGTTTVAGATLWSETTAALDQVVMRTQGIVNWGLKVFPLAGNCSVAPGVDVPIAPNNHAPIGAFLKRTLPNEVKEQTTPTGLAMRLGLDYLKTVKTTNPKYVVLATDGVPTCVGMTRFGGDDPRSHQDGVAAVGEVAAAGYPAFVVGISADGGASGVATLNAMADSGKRPRAGSPRYYDVVLKEELVAALLAITGQVVGCSFPLDKAPPSPDDVLVKVSGMPVDRDPSHAGGWDYGPGGKTVELFGTACDAVKMQSSSAVEIVFGCPGTPPIR